MVGSFIQRDGSRRHLTPMRFKPITQLVERISAHFLALDTEWEDLTLSLSQH